jgi:hypothetical protein
MQTPASESPPTPTTTQSPASESTPTLTPPQSGGKLELICAQQFDVYDDMYKIVDYLNRNLRKYNLMFGLSKDKEKESMMINIYEVD